jgi:hypothetical protein
VQAQRGASPRGRSATVFDALPFLRDATPEKRRYIASVLRPIAPAGRTLSQIKVAEIVGANRHRRLAEVIAESCMTDLCIDVRIEKLVPSTRSFNSEPVRSVDLSTRLFNLLLKHDLLKWDRLRRLRPRDLLALQGAGTGTASDVLAYAIKRGLEATSAERLPSDPGHHSSQRAALSKVIRDANGLLLLAFVDEFLAELPVSALAAPRLTAKPRRAVMQMGSTVSLQDVRRFLAGQSSESGLRSTFNTAQRRNLLSESLSQFDSRVVAWASAALWDDRLQWVVPTPLRLKTFRLNDRLLRSRVDAMSAFGRRVGASGNIEIWLPLVSIEGVIEIKKLRAPDVPYLRTALARGAAALRLDANLRPWDAAFSAKLAALPLTWLYQYSPGARMLILTERLERGGYTNVGHLGVLHPDALSIIRSSGVSDWIGLRSGLAQTLRR